MHLNKLVIKCLVFFLILIVHELDKVPMHHPPPPPELREWYHFVPWTLLSDILHVNMETVGMNSGGGHFQNGRHFKTTFAYISVSDTRRSMILVSIPMFSRSKNSMRSIITILDLMFQNGRQNFKMAAK